MHFDLLVNQFAGTALYRSKHDTINHTTCTALLLTVIREKTWKAMSRRMSSEKITILEHKLAIKRKERIFL